MRRNHGADAPAGALGSLDGPSAPEVADSVASGGAGAGADGVGETAFPRGGRGARHVRGGATGADDGRLAAFGFEEATVQSGSAGGTGDADADADGVGTGSRARTASSLSTSGAGERAPEACGAPNAPSTAS